MDRNTSSLRAQLARALDGILVETRYSQAGLARAAGVSRETVKLIAGEQTVPKATTLRMLADGAATDGAGHRDASKADSYYDRLMRAAGYLEDNIRVPITDLLRSVDDLTGEEVADALTRYSNDPELSVAFLGIAQEWTDLEPSAQRFLLWSIEETRRIDAQAKAANRRGATRPPRTRS